MADLPIMKSPDFENFSLLPIVHNLLYSLGITGKYVGFFHTTYAAFLTFYQPERLLLIIKWLYPDIAKHYNTSWKNVERSIHTAASIAWEFRPDVLCRMAMCSLDRRPTNSSFIFILAAHLRSQMPFHS